MKTLTVVGGGFAGVEATWAAAQRGVQVRLYEMRPRRMTPAHKTDLLAELVCSNSFKSKLPTSPAGQLKAEMAALGSLIIPVAERNSVPGGEALAVDREKFASEITRQIESHPLIELVREEFKPENAETLLRRGELLILATGPLTSELLAQWLTQQTGSEHLHFYDAVSPVVEASSLNTEVIFAQSRYDKGDGDDYLNCPLDKEQYEAFVQALVAAERAPIHEFEAGDDLENISQEPKQVEARLIEKIQYFAGCMPIEVIAERGARSLAFGNFKPVGLTDPRTGRRPYAALQLRPENREKALYSLVACQTRLKWGEQKRVFQLVPGLEKAEFVRFGVVHKNTYIDSPRVLNSWLEMKQRPGLFIAGQLTGVEGYVESAAMGIYAGITAARLVQGENPIPPPTPCAYGSLIAHLQNTISPHFAPMNINWGLFPEPLQFLKDKARRHQAKLEAAQTAFAAWLEQLEKLTAPDPVSLSS